MTATGTIRAAVEQRLIDKIAALSGFSTSADDDSTWWVTPPPRSDLNNKRWMVIGTYSGVTDPEAMAAGHGPQLDKWTIVCAAGVVGVDDAYAAKAEVEAAYNAVADMLAADARLTLPDAPVLGCELVTSSLTDGPNFAWDDTDAPFATVVFEISASASITRNTTG